MKKECREYAKHVAEEIEAIYNGTTEEENDDGEKMTLYDYVADALDFSAIVSSQKTIQSIRLYVTLGGPNCWIDTRNGEVVCAWGTDRWSAWLAPEICEEIDSYFEDFLNF